MEANIFAKSINYLKLTMAYLRFNLLTHLEYRGAFISQAIAMFVNNIIWVMFWYIFFNKFPVLRGYTFNDYITLWALASCGFGLATAIWGNGIPLAKIIAKGQLDTWMLYPRALLSHLMLGRMSATAIGDMAFGYLAYLVVVRPDFIHFSLFLILSFSAAITVAGFNIMTGSMSFYLGNAEGFADCWLNALICFSTYPETLFEGTIKVLLFTLLPAGFISYLPVQALKNLSITDAAYALAGATCIFLLSIFVFYNGLKRYESGNLMEMRG